MADFSSHYFKEISSLSKYVKDKLNRDSRLDRNQAVSKRPLIDAVLEEINMSGSRNDAYQMTKERLPNKTSNNFSLPDPSPQNQPN